MAQGGGWGRGRLGGYKLGEGGSVLTHRPREWPMTMGGAEEDLPSDFYTQRVRKIRVGVGGFQTTKSSWEA